MCVFHVFHASRHPLCLALKLNYYYLLLDSFWRALPWWTDVLYMLPLCFWVPSSSQRHTSVHPCPPWLHGNVPSMSTLHHVLDSCWTVNGCLHCLTRYLNCTTMISTVPSPSWLTSHGSFFFFWSNIAQQQQTHHFQINSQSCHPFHLSHPSHSLPSIDHFLTTFLCNDPPLPLIPPTNQFNDPHQSSTTTGNTHTRLIHTFASRNKEAIAISPFTHANSTCQLTDSPWPSRLM